MAKKKKERNEGEITAKIDAIIDAPVKPGEKRQDLAATVDEIKTEYESPTEVRARRTKEKAERKKAKERAAKK